MKRSRSDIIAQHIADHFAAEEAARHTRCLMRASPETIALRRDQRVLFEVMPEQESDPHECGPLLVQIDNECIRVWWSGDADQDPHWTMTWAEFRYACAEQENNERGIRALHAEAEAARIRVKRREDGRLWAEDVRRRVRRKRG